MADLFSNAIDAAASVLQRTGGLSCVVSDGENSVTVTMWRGGGVKSEGTDWGPQDWVAEDFLCKAEDLTFDGETLVEPEREWTITCDVAGVSTTFTVGHPGEGDPFRYSDRGHQLMRIHCRRGT